MEQRCKTLVFPFCHGRLLAGTTYLYVDIAIWSDDLGAVNYRAGAGGNARRLS